MTYASARRCILWPLVAAFVVACGTEPPADDEAYAHIMAFDSARVRLVHQRDTLALTLELAVSPEQKTMGLMERRHLADNAGMLFVYDSTQSGDAGFWMFRTRIPLDIAFLDSAGVIRAVRSMTPCPTTIAQGCPTYAPDVPYRYALEMSAGVFARRGIGVGNALVLSDVPKQAHDSKGTPSRR